MAARLRAQAAASRNGLAARRARRRGALSARPSLPTWKCRSSNAPARREPRSRLTCVVTPLIASSAGPSSRTTGFLKPPPCLAQRVSRRLFHSRLPQRRLRGFEGGDAELGVERLEARQRALGRE